MLYELVLAGAPVTVNDGEEQVQRSFTVTVLETEVILYFPLIYR